ncbi:MAG TPA: tetratricopeptide repeat protein [Bacteroidia bacterium]
MDSLSAIVAEGKSDTTTVNACISLCENYFTTGDYENVLKSSADAVKISESIGFKAGVMRAYFQQIKVLIAQGKLDMAMQLCIKELTIADLVGNTRIKASCYFQMGQIFENQKNYTNALVYYKKALDLAKKINYQGMIDAAISNIGNIYSEQGDHEKARACYYQSLAFAIRSNDSVSIADSYVNIGNEYFFQKDSKEAMDWYYKAVPIYSQSGIKNQLAICYINIASILYEYKDYGKSLEAYQKSIDISKELKQRSYLAEAYSSMANTYSKMGEYEKAFSSLQLSKSYYDSLYNEDMIAQTSELQTKYETEKKEKENEILKQQNELQNLSINRQRIINYSITLGLVLVLVLAFFIYKGYKQKQKANHQLEEKNMLIEEKNKIVEEKNKDITDSIRYAKRLQTAILKPEHTLTNYFDDGFILFKPKDIVSGDFYWFEKFGNLSLIAAADCTGHGVPGAFMSIIGCNLLSQAVNEYAITQPAAVLNSINKGLSKVLQQKGDADSFVTDGMDIALCAFNPEKMVLEYSGAYNPLWLVRDGTSIEFSADKFPVGAFIDKQIRIFNCHEIPVQKGDMIYLFSDGYADQFGGPLGKKFKYKPLQKLLLDNYKKPAQEQKALLNEAFESWMGKLEQIDDVLIIGIKI